MVEPEPRPEDFATQAEIEEDVKLLPVVAKRLRDRHATGKILLRYLEPMPWRFASDQGRDVLRARRLADLFPDRPLSGGGK